MLLKNVFFITEHMLNALILVVRIHSIINNELKLADYFYEEIKATIFCQKDFEL